MKLSRAFRPNNRMSIMCFGAFLIVGLGACASSSNRNSQVADSNSTRLNVQDGEIVSGDGSPIDDEILEADASLESPDSIAKGSSSRVPVEINENVQRWVDYFTVKDRERFQRFLDQGNLYRPLIEAVLKEEGVPSEFYYLALIESGFNAHAVSSARAVGIWQFMPKTATHFGLKRNVAVDERRDVVRATRAAARYIKRLYGMFDSWYLAMASYNAGEGRIGRAVKRGGTTDYWELVEGKFLPAETRDYVPKFLAAVMIGRHPERYGFSPPLKTKSLPELEAARLPPRVSLRDVAKHANLSIETLQFLNPHLIHSITPSHVSEYPIWVPKGEAVKIMKVVSHLPRVELPKSRRTVASVSSRHSRTTKVASNASYKVKSGDALGSIAKRFGTSTSAIMKTNRLSSSKIYKGQRLKLPASATRVSMR